MASERDFVLNIIYAGYVYMNSSTARHNLHQDKRRNKWYLVLLEPNMKDYQAPSLVRTTTPKDLTKYLQEKFLSRKYDLWTIYIEQILVIETGGDDQTFYLHTARDVHTVCPKTKQESCRWREALHKIKSEVTERMYHKVKSHSYIPIHGRKFRVVVEDTCTSRCAFLHGEYHLVVGEVAVALEIEQKGDVVCHWPFECINRFGYKDNIFVLEVDEKSDTGQGIFMFNTTQYSTIIAEIKNKILKRGQITNNPTECRPRLPIPSSQQSCSSGYSQPYDHRKSLFQRFGLQPPYMNVNSHRYEAVDPNERCIPPEETGSRCLFASDTSNIQHTHGYATPAVPGYLDMTGVHFAMGAEQSRPRALLPVPYVRQHYTMDGQYAYAYPHLQNSLQGIIFLHSPYENQAAHAEHNYSFC